MPEQPYSPIYEFTRGPVVESIHYGSIAVVDPGGDVYAWVGDASAVTYLRSSAKPFQALPFIERGGHLAFNLAPREVALICASHAGTDEHVSVVRGIQAKAGVQEGDLLCGIHSISHEETVEAMRQRGEALSPNRNNCSGKHTGMLACVQLRRQNGEVMPEDLPYIDPRHPHQQDILQTFSEMCGITPAEVAIGIDGCSVPTFSVPLWAAARAYARLCDPGELSEKRRSACQTITSSMMAHPRMIAGPGHFDTTLMEVTRGKIVSKGGAEGYQALGLMPGALGSGSPALGITLKISDGDLAHRTSPRYGFSGTTRTAVAIEVLRQLGALTPQELEAISAFGPVYKIYNHRGIEVGQGKPCFTLFHDA